MGIGSRVTSDTQHLQQQTREHFKDEYKEANEHYRFYANMRFLQLTLFVAITGGLIIVLADKESGLDNHGKIALAVVGFLTPWLFWTMEERAINYGRHFRERATTLELLLGYHQWRDLPQNIPIGIEMKTKELGVWVCTKLRWRSDEKSKGEPRVRATNAVRAMYIAAILFWASILLCRLG